MAISYKKCNQFLLLSLVSSALFSPSFASAESDKVPDLSSCAALKEDKSYEDDFDGLLYLIQGKDGWLFRTKQDLRAEFEIDEESLPLFQTFAKTLKEKGVELVVAVAPTRGMAASEFLPQNDLTKDYDPAATKKSYADFISAFNAAEIHTVGTPDLKTGSKYFYQTDLHWTTEGAREMAQAVADFVKTLPEYAALKKTEFVMTPAPEGEFEGNFTEAIEKLCNAKMPKEKATQIKVEAKASADQSAALFEEGSTPEVVLVGTSNSKRDDFDMNFAGSLKEFLSTDLQNAAIAGGGFDDSMLAYLTSESYKTAPAKVLIWEVPGYYNLQGDMARKSLRQLIPAALGDCGDKALAQKADILIGGDKAELFDSTELESVNGKKFYLHLMLNEPIQKKFSVLIKTGLDGKEELKFASSRNPDNRAFYYSVDGSEGAPVAKTMFKSMTLKATKELKDKKVTAKLCPL